jgi:hypothetical protein
MPGKHVHFASANQFYSPAPSTPSPTFSQSSLPDSNGPLTPPPIKHVGSPYSCTPLPPTDAPHYPRGSVAMNPLLAPGPTIVYDLTLDPLSITSLTGQRLSSRALAEPATHPPLHALTLTCRALPWAIPVASASNKPDSFVSVADVLHALSRALRQPISPTEYAQLLSPTEQRRVNEAFERRYRRLASDPPAYQVEKLKGVKRVDFLMGKTRFLGLSWTSTGPDVWELNVS